MRNGLSIIMLINDELLTSLLHESLHESAVYDPSQLLAVGSPGLARFVCLNGRRGDKRADTLDYSIGYLSGYSGDLDVTQS